MVNSEKIPVPSPNPFTFHRLLFTKRSAPIVLFEVHASAIKQGTILRKIVLCQIGIKWAIGEA